MIRQISRVLTQIEEYILCLMVLQMGLSIFLQVIMRYVFHSAITWLNELVHIEIVLLTFFGASLGIKYGAHICVDVLKNYAMQAIWHIRGKNAASVLSKVPSSVGDVIADGDTLIAQPRGDQQSVRAGGRGRGQLRRDERSVGRAH